MENPVDLKIRLAYLEQEFDQEKVSPPAIYNSIMALGMTGFFGLAIALFHPLLLH